MHAQMLMILMVTVLVAQVVLVEWRKRHFRSYQVYTCRFYFIKWLKLKIKLHFAINSKRCSEPNSMSVNLREITWEDFPHSFHTT